MEKRNVRGYITIDGQLPVALTEQRYLIGRGERCGILLSDGGGAASRRHALLESDAQEVWSIIDLDSRNGTFVNGERIVSRRTLHDGDRIGIGKNQIIVALPRSLHGPASGPTIYEFAAPSPESLANEHAAPAQWMSSADLGLFSRVLQVMGFALIVVSGIAYFSYIEPALAQNQSLGGQLAGGLMSLTGNDSYARGLQTLTFERLGSIIGGFVGAGLILATVLKRR